MATELRKAKRAKVYTRRRTNASTATENDDNQPNRHPYAVLSYDYWTRRFGHDRNVVGRTFRLGADTFETVGVAEERFTGTETGTVTDIFVPTMMDPRVDRSDTTWIRTLAQLKPGVAVEPVRAKLHATSRALEFEEERAKGFIGMPKASIDKFLDQTLKLESAAAGAFGLQQDYGRSLVALGVLVALVLFIACANVANLMTAQASARSREMALRVSIGAGTHPEWLERLRLDQRRASRPNPRLLSQRLARLEGDDADPPHRWM